ncbi:MAG TPA: MazG-like family protein [Rubrivivax sp.]|nr:MazG-like family protein [Rubrivivax sp.]
MLTAAVVPAALRRAVLPLDLCCGLQAQFGPHAQFRELLEHFQWLTEAQSRALASEKRDAVGAEVADVLLYLIQLASALGIDPIAAAKAKLELNELKYLASLARGNSKKYDEP